MKDKFDELVEELALDEVEDFDIKTAKYEIYLYNYDAEQNILDESTLVGSYADPELAIKKAQEFASDTDALERLAAKDAIYVSVEVETTVEREDTVENIGTLFTDGIKIR